MEQNQALKDIAVQLGQLSLNMGVVLRGLEIGLSRESPELLKSGCKEMLVQIDAATYLTGNQVPGGENVAQEAAVIGMKLVEGAMPQIKQFGFDAIQGEDSLKGVALRAVSAVMNRPSLRQDTRDKAVELLGAIMKGVVAEKTIGRATSVPLAKAASQPSVREPDRS